MLKRMYLFVVMCILLSSADSFFIEVGVAHGLERIGLHDPVPGTRKIMITTARNEYEPFQVVISSNRKVENAVISAGDLYSGDGTIFSKENFTFFHVHYIYVKTPSPRSGAGPGWYPDGLSPVTAVDILPGENTVIWVDVYTPEDQPPGVYTGSLLIDAGSPVELPLTVEVWDFTLPKTPTLRSSFGVSHHEIYRAHNLDWDSPEYDPTFYHYYETLINHRIMPGDLLQGIPEVHEDGSIDTTESHKHLKYFMDTLQVNSSAYPLYDDWPFQDPFGRNIEATTHYLQTLFEYYSRHGWEDSFFVYVIDEPNDRKAYEEVRYMGGVLDSIHPGITFLVTEQLTPDDPSWGTLYGYVDIWCPLFFCIEEEQSLIKTRQRKGEEIWTYTALCQGEKETPYWELDFPVLNYRVIEWMIWQSKISGILYWSTNYWERVEDPWENPATWGEGSAVYNGEGSLLYPAEHGCSPSLRLKVLREGMEDYEYFALLASLGEESFADQQVRRVVKSWYTWDENPDILLEVRTILGEKIHSMTSESLLEAYKEEGKYDKEEEKTEKQVDKIYEEKEGIEVGESQSPVSESQPFLLEKKGLLLGICTITGLCVLAAGLILRKVKG